MYIILWEYRVKPEKQTEFEYIYAPSGGWANLFKNAAGYISTELLRDENRSEHYLTIDRWDTKESYEIFQLEWKMEYKALDERCEGLTENEILLGKWETI